MKRSEKGVTSEMDETATPTSHFAPAERATGKELVHDVYTVSHNPVVDGLMRVANGLLAVLNEHRQVLAVNESFLRLMGLEDPATILGLRPGEIVHCVHACDMPGGCGTSKYCTTCGAVVSIMAAMENNQTREGTCSITVEKDNRLVDLFFQVRCIPISIRGRRFTLFFLLDISIQQQRANLEASFFHDINNLLTGLLGKSEIFLRKGVWDSRQFSAIQKLIQRTVQEFSIQQALSGDMSHCYQPLYCTVSVNSILDDLRETFEGHRLSWQVKLDIDGTDDDATLVTDPNLVDRILYNMVTNALEASESGDVVRVYVEWGGNSVTFCVWNGKHIPEEHALRIFTRNFSTKKELGHGLGTYAMKLFGEKVLGGTVDFDSSKDKGTTFRLTLMQS